MTRTPLTAGVATADRPGAHVRARQVITPSGGIMRAKFPSRKNGRLVHCEGLLELDAAYLFEVHPGIESFREQPATIHYPDGSRVRRYTPDFELTLVSGEQLWVEIKPETSMAQPEVQRKLGLVADHLATTGRPFVVLTDGVLRKEPRRTNVQRVVARSSRSPLTVESACIALDRCRAHLPGPLASVATALAPHGKEPYSLMQRGLLQFDLSEPLDEDTLIHITEESDDGWIQLSQEHGF
jgi:hypothetical protein